MTTSQPLACFRDPRGSTLAEILMGLAITGVALAALAVTIPVSSYAIQEGHQLSTATFLAEQTIERAHTSVWTQSPPVDCLGVSAGDTAPVAVGATCRGAVGTQFPDEPAGIGGYPEYRRRVRVSSCAATPCAGVATAGLRRVTVTVAYTPLVTIGATARPTTVQLEWLVAQK